MADLFATLRALQSVERVSNLYNPSLPLNLIFFLCPNMSNKGLRLNSGRTGLRAEYREGPAKSTEERLAKLVRFLGEAHAQEIQVRVQAIFATADALVLFPIPVALPVYPEAESALLSRIGLCKKTSVLLATNGEAFERHRDLFAQFYEAQPWRSSPARVYKHEEERLQAMLPEGTPEYVAADFIRRTFAGFALDGVLLRRGFFGRSPVILGVESPGVPILQNAALSREEWLPVVQLR